MSDEIIDVWLTLPQINELYPNTPRNRNTALAQIKAGKFPPPDGKAGNYNIWRNSTILRYYSAVPQATPRKTKTE